MIAVATFQIEVDMDKLRDRGSIEIAFLTDLLVQCHQQGLAPLHPATRKIPAGQIGMPHQKDPALFIETGRTHAKRGPAREQENEMHKADEDTPVERTGLLPCCLVIHPGFSALAGFYWTCHIS